MDLANVAWEFLAAPPGVIVMPAAHPLAARPEIRARDLTGMPWIALAPEDRARRRLDTVLAKAGVRMEVVAETPFSATVCEFAVLGMGIGLANSSMTTACRWRKPCASDADTARAVWVL